MGCDWYWACIWVRAWLGASWLLCVLAGVVGGADGAFSFNAFLSRHRRRYALYTALASFTRIRKTRSLSSLSQGQSSAALTRQGASG